MNKGKKLIVVLCIIMSFSQVTVWGQDTKQAYALNQFSGEVIDEAEILNISDNNVKFVLSGNIFDFDISEFEMNTNSNMEGTKYYSGQNGNLICNMVEYNGNYSIQILNLSESCIAREQNPQENFTIEYGADVASNIPAIQNVITTDDCISEYTASPVTRATGNALHVYTHKAGGTSSEGWCTAKHQSGNTYVVNSISYVVNVTGGAKSDGVDLFYSGDSVAVSSPLNPDTRYTTINGSWVINLSKGFFQASASKVTYAPGIVIPYIETSYDVCYMSGIHQ